ncbi:hypothetical protein ANN_23284 [Periplaneta americana]|uniref:DUF4817 domain-containing protein n=1 Tax=Periplaneta americana TaxID=6978 RepID=A0ABQ8SLP2_PERAM|nr:hypothetical protein ANN_23284 [Periplaneta americana]
MAASHRTCDSRQQETKNNLRVIELNSTCSMPSTMTRFKRFPFLFSKRIRICSSEGVIEFLSDLTKYLNDLTTVLQDKYNLIDDAYNSVKSFQPKSLKTQMSLKRWVQRSVRYIQKHIPQNVTELHLLSERSLPSKETLRGHSDSSFRDESYIQCCVGVRLCDMYSNQELAEIHFMYGKADGNAALARRLYQERYPQRQCPNRKTFVRLHYRLCEYGKFNCPGLGRGRPRSTTPEVQEEILEAVNMTPSISIRRVAFQVNVPHTTVWRLLKEYHLYPYHLQRVQALSPADYPARVRFCRVRKSMRHRCEVCIQAGGVDFEHLL